MIDIKKTSFYGFPFLELKLIFTAILWALNSEIRYNKMI